MLVAHFLNAAGQQGETFGSNERLQTGDVDSWADVRFYTIKIT